MIGRGGFGKVYQVRHKATRKIYAMKVLSKADLKRRNQIERAR
jgi:serine/threonine protein kinase